MMTKRVKHVVVLFGQVKKGRLVSEAFVQVEIRVQKVRFFVELLELVDANVVLVQELGHVVDFSVCRGDSRVQLQDPQNKRVGLVHRAGNGL